MRRGVRNVLGASTVLLCLGGGLVACGGGSGDGYVATGAAAERPAKAPGSGVAPTGDVELVPLDGSEAPPDGDGGGSSRAPKESGSADSGPAGDSPGGKSPGGSESSGAPAESDGSAPVSGGDDSGRTESPSARPSAPGTSTSPPGPAKLSVGEPELKPADERWCEKVTVAFRNTGETAVRSGTVTFETHVIGALGVDWATLESTEKLPAPIGAGKRVEKTWPVCVDPWRVPLGMHVETRDVSVKWK
ncbi:hypothetical protein [Streptomyces sp. MZ04]|uniref:hypothetical protein n=1 Tax=Streptomyces sp. MZ04 TaxID=2559236 RepID=UPI00107E6862|nr:hypothetical protein [Streptomyces sp. MZ04]TGB10429.1 hypothetical protein E2651_14600 [Streptomyces sp. MZ04]